MGILVYLKSFWEKPHPIETGGISSCKWNLADLNNDSDVNNEKYKELLREGAKLMVSRDYDECISVYRQASEEAKTERHFCDLQIAQAYRMKGEPLKSMDFYWAACIHGADREQVEELIWCLINKSSETQDTYIISRLLSRLLTHFPEGKYKTEASEWLSHLIDKARKVS